ncbi:hypothetical protein [Arthrobacter sp. StoSoilB5]|uniref:hypothetical protein n=1 Tax=Arthrobacter sp. StoSoilB5 TaxID=2830992 RepID=UPI001CC48FA7|nr:hypothetical protein [Arthrobacter sp. StoSoilB5]
MSLWNDLGFTDNPFDSRSLAANSEGLTLLVGREREKRELMSKLTSSTLHASLEGDNGVGKTSLVLVTVYEAIQKRFAGTLGQTLVPVDGVLQLGTDANVFHREALLAIAQSLIKHEGHFKDLRLTTPNLSELKRWMNEPIVSSGGGGVQILGIGAEGQKTDEVNTSVGFENSGLERLVRDALKKVFPTQSAGGLVAIIDNVELLGRSSEAGRVLEKIRDTTLSLPGVRWVLCGAKGIIRASVSSPRLNGRISRPIEVTPIADSRIEELIGARLNHFAARDGAVCPVGATEFLYLYEMCHANLRDAFRYAQDFCSWLEIEDKLHLPQVEYLPTLKQWLALEAQEITASIRLQPRMWQLFDDLAALGGVCSPSDHEALGFNSPQRMRSNFAEVQRVGLIDAEIDEDDTRRRTVTLTAKGWLVHHARKVAGETVEVH